MAVSFLDGPRVAAASGGPAEQLVVFLHGVGADGHDLIGLAPAFAERLPDADFVSPHAPFSFDMAPMGRQWFSLIERSPQAIIAGIEAAAPLLNAFLDKELAARGLSDDRLALVGFSQGTMMALFVALRRARACAALVGYSGHLAAADRLAAEIAVRPPVLLVHGDADDVVSYGCLALAEQGLAAVGVPVTALTCRGLGHGIDDAGMAAGIDFVTRGFGAESKPGGR